ncbi:MAG: GT2 family glycosyltransferase [Polaribacter sp.]|jgi:GT2 family glycosyltransferase
MVTAAVVLFNENLETLKKTVDSFLEAPLEKKLFLIDNSPKNRLEKYFKHPAIEYIFVGENIGFGAAHNMILDKINSEFHLILNPDVVFSSEVIPALIKIMKEAPSVSFVTPKVRYPNKEVQKVCRKHPTIMGLLNRRLKRSKNGSISNEYKYQDFEKRFHPDFIHGCFMLFKTIDFKNLKGFDTRYFLYFEDADICRKIDLTGKNKLYYPGVQITHQYRRGSSKSVKLFFHHLSSAVKYFLKWGF